MLLRGYRLSVSVPKIIFFLLSILKTSSNFTQIQVEPHLNPKMTLSCVGYFFVPDPLGGLKKCPGGVYGHAESIGTFLINNFLGPKFEFFPLRGGEGGIGLKMTKFSSGHFSLA